MDELGQPRSLFVQEMMLPVLSETYHQVGKTVQGTARNRPIQKNVGPFFSFVRCVSRKCQSSSRKNFILQYLFMPNAWGLFVLLHILHLYLYLYLCSITYSTPVYQYARKCINLMHVHCST